MITVDSLLEQGAPPIVAILRGLKPDEAIDIAGSLITAGLRILEVPFNSPEPATSIRLIQQAFGDVALIGGGTVVTETALEELAATGARLMVAPNADTLLIGRALALGLEPMPGVMTPTEAFAALAAGARHLKLFPAGSLGPGHLRALRDVLPPSAGVWAVGGAGPDTLKAWLAAGVTGFGIGGSLYRPGDDSGAVGARATKLVDAWRHAAAKDFDAGAR